MAFMTAAAVDRQRMVDRWRMSGSDTVLLEQRRDLRLAAAKLDERLERIAAAATRQDAVEKAPRGGAIKRPALDERRKRVRRQYLGPFIAVVAGGVATGKDVAEAVRVAIPLRHRHHRHFVPHLIQDLVHAPTACR